MLNFLKSTIVNGLVILIPLVLVFLANHDLGCRCIDPRST